jgi:hypothetical protein
MKRTRDDATSGGVGTTYDESKLRHTVDDRRHKSTRHSRHSGAGHGQHHSHKPHSRNHQNRYKDHHSGRDSHFSGGYPNREPSNEVQNQSDSDEWVIVEESESIYESIKNQDSILTGDITDVSGLNRLKAEILKAELKSSPELAQLREKYAEAEQRLTGKRASNQNIKVLDNKLLHRTDEVKDLSVQEMLRDEILSKERGDKLNLKMAEQIARDGGYMNDLDYADDNAEKLARIQQKSEKNLKNQVISKTKSLHEAIDNCSFCLENETADTTIISVGTRVYLCLAAEPTLARGTSVIVPIDHHVNTMQCDDDEWEEIRNFMKSLCQMWANHNKGVLFYENAVIRSDRQHGAIVAVPVHFDLLDGSPGFFSQSIVELSEEWASHRSIIDTSKKAKQSSPEAAKFAFRSSIAKEAPYFHVWFDINGGMGHIVEESEEWPKGDLFARQVIGGMLQLDPSTIRREGEFRSNNQGRAYFESRWKPYDWTQVLD